VNKIYLQQYTTYRHKMDFLETNFRKYSQQSIFPYIV